MLHIQFGEMENVCYGPLWFVNSYIEEWLSDPLVGEMLRDVDKSEYRGGSLIISDVLGPISPRELSGGVKTLISIYKEPTLVFDATSCGENCAKWLLEIGKREDVTVNLNYPMTFDGLDPIEIHIVNTDKVLRTDREYTLEAISILNEERMHEG